MLFSAWPCWSYMVKRWYKRYHSPPFPAAIGEKRPHGQSRFPTIPGQKAKTLGHLGPFHTNVSFQITDPQGSFSIRMKVPVKNHLSERAALHWVCQQLWIIRVLSLKGGTFFYHLPFADTPGFPIQLRQI